MAARRLATVLVGLLVALLPPAARAAPAADPLFTYLGAIELPNGFGAIEVDAGTGRVFVSSPTSNVVTVVEGDGRLWGGFPVPGAGALLVDGPTLYVASTTEGRIDAFDTTTLAKIGSFGTGALQSPHGLVKAGGRLWTTTGGCNSGAQLVSIVPATAEVTVHPSFHGLDYCLVLFTTPVQPNLILAFETGISPTSVERIDVSTGVPVRAGSLRTGNSNSRDGQFLPDGQTFALASGSPREIRTFRSDPLQQLGVTYPVAAGPVAVESTAGASGLIAAGLSGYYSDDIQVFRLGDPSTTVLRHDFGSTSNVVLDRGLAFGGDGTRLYAVAGDPFLRAVTLEIFGPPHDGGRYHPLPPARVLDTRDGGPSGRIGARASIDVQVAGQGGVPASGVTAVAMNVTVTQPTAASFLTLFPTGTTPPGVSNLNFTAGQTVPNLAVVKVGTGGKVSMYNEAGSVDVVLDVAGWFSETSTTGDAGRYTPIVPTRFLDTRASGVQLGPGASLVLQVAGRGGIPESGAMAAVLNVTATGATAPSFLTVYPSGGERPLASTLNFDAGDTVSNRAMVMLGVGGGVTLYNLAGSVDIVVDVAGWYNDASLATPAGAYSALPPTRILDTRDGPLGPLPGGSAMEVRITGRAGMPPIGVRAVILNATVVAPAGPGFLTIFPSSADVPVVSDVNYANDETRSNLTVVQVGADGKVGVYVSTTTDVVLDVAGWFS